MSWLDIETQLLNAEMLNDKLEDAVYVIPPRILVSLGLVGDDEIWILFAIYGLRVSPRLWRKLVARSMKTYDSE